MRIAAVIAGSTAALALLAAGCGGSGEASSAEEAWAGSVCASIATWQTDVEAIAKNAADAITEPGATRTDIETAIDGGVAATRTLVDDLRALTPPDTPQGEQAKADVETFLDDAQASINEVEQAIADLPDAAGLAEVIAKLSGLASNLQSTIQSGRDLVDSLPELGSDLKAGFENADSCEELRKSRS